MKYNIAIVEDDHSCKDTIKSYLDKFSIEHHIQFTIFSYEDGDEITSEYEAKYDIIFLDIEMKRQDGMQTAQKIREFDKEVIIIFITNMAQYAISGYSVGALSFLLKPVPYFAFSQELSKSIDRLKNRQQKSILISSDKGVIKINSAEIMFIESFGHELVIHTIKETFSKRGTIKRMEEELSDLSFYRCNNGYIVNLSYVSGVQNDEAIVGKHKLKISRSRKKQFMEALTQYIGGLL